MKERVIIVHGWAAHPEFAWQPWVADQLRQKGYDVVVPEMPNAYEPTVESWLSTLEEIAATNAELYEKTHFIGHSIGCQTILRFLHRSRMQTGTCVFVAGWFSLTGLDEDEMKIAAPWLANDFDLGVVGKQIERAVALFSDNDEYVQLNENKRVYEEQLGAEAHVMHGMDHFDGCTELREAVAIFP